MAVSERRERWESGRERQSRRASKSASRQLCTVDMLCDLACLAGCVFVAGYIVKKIILG